MKTFDFLRRQKRQKDKGDKRVERDKGDKKRQRRKEVITDYK